jgi:pimeloyl-ACP methyl ester carboxylesterase
MALADPARVRTLTLVEPVFFAALRYVGETAAYEDLRRIRDAFAARLAHGEREAALEHFLDFWMGDGAWRATPEGVRSNLLKMADKIDLDWQASFAADPGANRLAVLGPRALLVRGSHSPDPMRRLVDALHALMPGSTKQVIAGANHLLPQSHAPTLTSAIMAHLHADAERRLR